MEKIHLNLYSGYYNHRGYKFAKVLKKLYTRIYLSACDNKKKTQTYRYEDINTQNKIKSLSLKNSSYLGWMLNHIIYFRNKNVKTISIHNLKLMPIGVILKFFFKAKVIYEPHELETETLHKRKLKKFISKIIERICIKFVDYTVVVSPSIAKWYKRTYNISMPLVVNNSRFNQNFKKKNIFRKKFKIKKNKTIFLYNGNINKEGRGLHKLLEAFSNNENSNNVIIFMGSGGLVKKIKAISKKNDNIFYHKPAQTRNLHFYTSSADVGICLIENTCLNENYCLPNKLFEYLSGGIPVVVSNLFELKNFIEKNRCGYVYNLENDNLNKFIKQISLKRDLDAKSKNAKKTAIKYDWKNEEKKIINIYNNI